MALIIEVKGNNNDVDHFGTIPARELAEDWLKRSSYKPIYQTKVGQAWQRIDGDNVLIANIIPADGKFYKDIVYLPGFLN